MRRIFLIALLSFGYFFHGGGWNQASQFDLIRALVERGEADITAYHSNTGDIGYVGAKIFSNKAPGVALIGYLPYRTVLSLERMSGFDLHSPTLITANAHLMTFLLSGLPGAALVGLIFAHFRRRAFAPRDCRALALAFAFGTLVFPYSGMLMHHNLETALLFGSWYLLTYFPARTLGAGLLLGAAGLCDYLVFPLTAILLLIVPRQARYLASFLVGPLLALSVSAAFSTWAFGSPWSTSYQHQSTGFSDPGLFLGVFALPDLRRIYWLTIHPAKGLLFCCPLLILAITGALWQRPPVRLCVPLLLVGWFLLFNFCFHGWSGGTGIGPRYLIPAIPFLYLFIEGPYRRLPVLFRGLAILSSVLMLLVTVTDPLVPQDNFAPPDVVSPFYRAIRAASRNQVSTSTQSILEYWPRDGFNAASDNVPDEDRWDSYNLGELFGFSGALSLFPLVLVASLIWTLGTRLDARKGVA